MCMTCGCGKPHDRHGDERNIVMEDLERAAEASNITMEKAIENIQQTAKQTAAQSRL